MNLFRKAGATFEEQKRKLLGGDGPAYVCSSCEESTSEDAEYCPHCGEASVEPVQ